MDEPIREFGAQVFTPEYTGYVVLGFLFILLAAFSQRWYYSGKKSYGKMFQAVAPSLKEGPSPFDAVFSGSLGCIQAIIAVFLLIIFVFLAIDALLFQSQYLLSFLAQLR